MRDFTSDFQRGSGRCQHHKKEVATCLFPNKTSPLLGTTRYKKKEMTPSFNEELLYLRPEKLTPIRRFRQATRTSPGHSPTAPGLAVTEQRTF